MKVSCLLQLILKVSEKASAIARIIRNEKPLVALLVEEKSGIEKNSRFFQDFKTLADVLIQETVRHYISQEVPEIGESIYGEESNTFTNTAGQSVRVEICDTCEATQELLKTVLGGHVEAARLLAEAVHSDVSTDHSLSNYNLDLDIDPTGCGIWIDPIDSTGQYIKGKTGQLNKYGMVVDGLQCVAVLVGVFQKETGQPILGVAVQPFSQFSPEFNSWSSRTIWGVCYQDVKVTSLHPASDHSPHQELSLVSYPEVSVVVSSSEAKAVLDKLASKFRLMFASGAGYKILATALGLANAYVLSHRTIYRWDCCAVHAILLALGGGIVSYKHTLEAARQTSSSLAEQDLTHLQVSYIRASGAISNRRASLSSGTESLPGIIAYRATTDVLAIVDLLK